jgi:radical SAM protein with 4Fe4S-binding SPASM domain
MEPVFLREEYFGGILYSQRIPGAVPIPEPHWSSISGASDVSGADALRGALRNGSDGRLASLVDQCRYHGAFDSELRLRHEVFRQAHPLVGGVLSAPLRAYLHITEHCNLKCQHCMFACGSQLEKTPEMKTEQIFEVLRRLQGVRCPELRITGGEPTLRRDLAMIVTEAKRRGFYVMINTNGVFGQSVQERIAEAGPHELIFSLDGRPEHHDLIRGRSAFERLEKNLRFFSQQREQSPGSAELTVNFTFGRHNAMDLEWVIRFAAGLGVHVNLMPVRPFGAACNLPDVCLAPAEFMSFTEQVARLRGCQEVIESGIRIIHKNFDLESRSPDARDQPTPFDRSSCGASTFGLGINPDGRTNACGFLAKDSRFVGPSLLDLPFEEIWYSPPIHGFRCIVRIGCESCEHYRVSCSGGCKAMALASGGGRREALSGPDPYCYADRLARRRTP